MTFGIGLSTEVSRLIRLVAGRRCSHWAISTWSSSPSQNTGIEIPTTDPTRTPASESPPLRWAARIPSGIPTARAITIATKISSSVAGSLVAMPPSTGSLVASDLPQSP